MPRKKEPPKFKYTTRLKNGDLYVRYQVKGAKYPDWKKCETETQEEISRLIEVIKVEHKTLRAEEGRPKTIKEFAASWLDAVRPNLAERTYADYEELFNRYIEKKIGSLLLSEVTA